MDNNQKRLPFVTAMLLTKNEENYIEKALMSFVNQTYPQESYEVMVVDGCSDDKTVEIVNRIIDKYSTDTFNIRLLNNPGIIQSAGWNICIKNARGEYIVRFDAHGEVAPDFIEKSVETMLRVDAAGVGGKIITKSVEGSNEIVSKVLSSPFGVGNSPFRVSDKEGYADNAAYTMFKKDILVRVGGFDERLVRSEDNDINARIHKAGGKIYFNPNIKSVYYARNSVKKMIKQGFSNGKWNMALLKKDKSSLCLRHLVPLFFVLYMIFSSVLGFFCHPIWIIEAGVLLLYFILGIVFACKKTKKLSEIMTMPLLFFLLHVAYGNGYFAGLTVKMK